MEWLIWLPFSFPASFPSFHLLKRKQSSKVWSEAKLCGLSINSSDSEGEKKRKKEQNKYWSGGGGSLIEKILVVVRATTPATSSSIPSSASCSTALVPVSSSPASTSVSLEEPVLWDRHHSWPARHDKNVRKRERSAPPSLVSFPDFVLLSHFTSKTSVFLVRLEHEAQTRGLAVLCQVCVRCSSKERKGTSSQETYHV